MLVGALMSKSSFILLFSFLFHLSVQACELEGIEFNNDFPGASSNKMLHSCSINSAGNKIKFVLQPENTPINDSPWYAFQLSSAEKKSVKVHIEVKDGHNRYPPKISHDGINWQPIKHEFTDSRLSFKLTLSDKPTWVAAQEIITNQAYIDWGKKLAQKPNIEHFKIGESVLGKPIYALNIIQNPNAKEYLVILGRQHPPEITGALALFPFSATMLSSSQLAKVYRNRYNLLIVPNLNPDGVELGHWRHNHNGVDLNRDWKSLQQPEVKAVHDHIQSLVKQGYKMSMAVDFHSTKRDIFYTMPNDYGMEQRYLVNNWLNKLDAQYTNFSVIQRPGSNPCKGVFKQYFSDEYNVHAITYEMGDNTNRQFIYKLAIDAANNLMKTMLQDNQELR